MEPATIELRLYASLRKWHEAPSWTLEVRRPLRISDFVKEIGIPEAEVAIIFLNGKRAGLGCLLSNGDTLDLFPAIGGG